jgi:hypothetical protein
MANASYLKSLFGGADATLRRGLDSAWDYLLSNLRFGRPSNGTRAENHQSYFFSTTTPAVADTEFTIEHGMDVVPYLILPVLPLTLGARLVRLRVSRAPDSRRIYLSSPDTDAPVTILLEG